MTRVVMVNGAEIAAHTLGPGDAGSKDLLLAHATGFPARVWDPFVGHLPPRRFRAVALDGRGHGQSSPLPVGGMAWADLAADVLAVVDGLGLDRPLAVGHSSGASLLLLAEEARPGTFAGLYCIEPIGASVDQPPAPDAGHPMAERALRRRAVFASRQEAVETYAAKPPLSSLAPEVLQAYVDHGFADTDDGSGQVRLRCRPEDEAGMYAHGLSHHAFRDLPKVGCPVVLARGEHSTTVTPETLGLWAARLPHATIEVLAGLGHLAPLEDPAAVAAAVTAAFDLAGLVPRRVTGPLYPGGQ